MLNIESGRHTNTPRFERKCERSTNNDIEDEFHCVTLCPLYNDLWNKCIINFYHTRPSVHQLTHVLDNTNRKVLIHFGFIL